ncbi:MAG: SDR family oxidoreductase [Ignavibacteriaceae bacterium]|nr:SDR family oxidoreductase [Ignavibacteriaceae bacterium]
MNIMFSLEGKIALVTGALGLLGQEHCKALSEAGATVIAADLDDNACEEFASSISKKAVGMKLDVTNKNSLLSARSRIVDTFGQLDVLVNNAAINDMLEDPKTSLEESKFENYPLEAWNKAINVNLTGVFLCSQILGSHMAHRGSGSIINIASTYGMVAPNQSLYKDASGNQVFFKPPAYSASKGAVVSFTKYLAAYWGERNVRVNALSPGGVQNNQAKYFVENYSALTPIKRMANKFDFKGALVFLASDASSYMTGANLVVDGGWTCW